MTDFSKNILYDKALSIEGWAYRLRRLIEAQAEEKLLSKACERIRKDTQELCVLMKVNPDDKG